MGQSYYHFELKTSARIDPYATQIMNGNFAGTVNCQNEKIDKFKSILGTKVFTR